MLKSGKTICVLALSLAVISVSFSAGCTPSKKQLPAPRRQVEVRPYSLKNPATTVEDRDKINNKLTASLAGVKNVKRATAVILGTSAYVGLDINPGLSRNQIRSVKTMSASKIKTAEPRIRSVWVTTQPTAFKRIEQVRSDIRNKKPSSKYSRNLRLILDQSELVR